MRGRPILGAVSGFLFGLFLGATLFLFGVVPLHSQWLWILPLVGIALGLLMAAWAPFGKAAAATPATTAGTMTSAASGQADVTGDGTDYPAGGSDGEEATPE